MKVIIRIKRRAVREIHAAAKWWSEHRDAAPDAIQTELEAAFDLLVQQPNIGIIVPGAKDPSTRKLYLPRIRYCLYFRLRGEYLEVVAFWHSARGREPRV